MDNDIPTPDRYPIAQKDTIYFMQQEHNDRECQNNEPEEIEKNKH